MLVLTFFTCASIYAQTGVGTYLPHTASVLDVNSKDKGVLIPRVTLTSDTDTKTITGSSYPESLMVYHVGNVNLASGYYYWEKNKWNAIISSTTINNFIKNKQLAGDVTGDLENNTLSFIKKVPLSSVLPTTTGQALIYNATTNTWEPGKPVVESVGKADLTTDGVIVVGAATAAGNVATGAVLSPTSLSIKNGSITGGKIAAGTVAISNLANSGIKAPRVLSTDVNGNPQWEERGNYVTYRENISTDNIIVVGDGVNGKNKSENNPVLVPTTLSIRNASITGTQIAGNAIGSSHIAPNAVNGGIHITNATMPLGKLTNGTANAILTTTAAGVPQWEPKTSLIPTVPVITANNGLTKTGNNIELGGVLAKVTTIATSVSNTLRISGLGVSKVVDNVDSVVMIERATGALKQASSSIPNFFYLPPINIKITPGATNQTLNLYTLYSTQYNSPRAVSTPGIKLPVFSATQLNYFVIYADPAVFSSISVNASGVITYSIAANARPTGATFITVVLQVK